MFYLAPQNVKILKAVQIPSIASHLIRAYMVLALAFEGLLSPSRIGCQIAKPFREIPTSLAVCQRYQGLDGTYVVV
ncbi:MAG TPA: hypothetical protein VF370_00390 [Candidatus Cryosericum sp.]